MHTVGLADIVSRRADLLLDLSFERSQAVVMAEQVCRVEVVVKDLDVERVRRLREQEREALALPSAPPARRGAAVVGCAGAARRVVDVDDDKRIVLSKQVTLRQALRRHDGDVEAAFRGRGRVRLRVNLGLCPPGVDLVRLGLDSENNGR